MVPAPSSAPAMLSASFERVGAYEWNRLQEALGELFADAIHNNRQGFAIWYSTPNDRAQREMLRAAVDMGFPITDTVNPPRERVILWLLGEIEKVADRRDDAIHAPLVFVNTSDGIDLSPMYWLGNPRARKLRDKDLLTEFKWYRSSAAALGPGGPGLARRGERQVTRGACGAMLVSIHKDRSRWVRHETSP
jgi:hypothetical protein